MRTIHVPLEQGYGTGTWESAEDLLIRGPRAIHSTPHVVHYFDETASVRRESGGPIGPGPYAFVTARYTESDDDPVSHLVKRDDRIEIAGHIFSVRVTDEFVALDLVESPVGARS